MRTPVSEAATIAIASLLVGCTPASNSATEIAVEPTPGLYRASIGTGGAIGAMSQGGPGSDKVDEICIGESDVAEFPGKLVRNYLMMHPTCDVEENPRVGNSIGGKIICPVDPQRATGEFVIDYSGSIAADRIVVDAKMSPNVASKDPNDATDVERGAAFMAMVPLQAKAERVGDCP